MSSKRRYALVGSGGRARFFYSAIVGEYKETSQLVALCDVNQVRMNYANQIIQEEFGGQPANMYGIDQFDEMIQENEGGHGGGDPVLLNDLFGTPQMDPFNRAASHVDGAMSILTGIAANMSIKTGQAIQIKELVQL